MYVWRDAVLLPVLDGTADGRWSLDGLDEVLRASHLVRANESRYRNGFAAVCLSGGLDSSLSLAILRSVAPDLPVHCFTIGGHDRHQDVLSAKAVADKFGIEHTVIIPDACQVEMARHELQAKTRAIETDGSVGVYMLYRAIAVAGVRWVIVHDGIDELMGGYWSHREFEDERQAAAFRREWDRLVEAHLIPLDTKARFWGVQTLFPYLDPVVVRYISRIPLAERTSRLISKMPLRALGEKYGLPPAVLTRKKMGQCDCLRVF